MFLCFYVSMLSMMVSCKKSSQVLPSENVAPSAEEGVRVNKTFLHFKDAGSYEKVMQENANLTEKSW